VAGRQIFKPPVIYAAAIERTHFHLLTGVMREDVGTFMGRIKGMTSSAICALPENAGRRHVWTAHYWEVFLFDEGGVDAVQTYIEAHNVRRGLSPNPYSWAHPRRLRK
jgi:REP element-mobilizing transposase RayT